MKTSSRAPRQSRKREYSSLWTAHLTEEDKRKEFVDLLQMSRSPINERLLEIVQGQLEGSRDSTLKQSNYDSPSWAYIQADNVGYQRALRLVEQLLQDIVK
jgi:hypothetical protein